MNVNEPAKTGSPAYTRSVQCERQAEEQVSDVDGTLCIYLLEDLLANMSTCGYRNTAAEARKEQLANTHHHGWLSR